MQAGWVGLICVHARSIAAIAAEDAQPYPAFESRLIPILKGVTDRLDLSLV